MRAASTSGISIKTLPPLEAPILIKTQQEIAISVLEGLSSYLDEHSLIEKDKMLAKTIAVLPLNRKNAEAAVDLIETCFPYITFIEDSKNYSLKGKCVLITMEHVIEISKSHFEGNIVCYQRNRHKIKMSDEEDKISFHTMTIAKGGLKALDAYEDFCCTIS